jgi:hypothetical protein
MMSDVGSSYEIPYGIPYEILLSMLSNGDDSPEVSPGQVRFVDQLFSPQHGLLTGGFDYMQATQSPQPYQPVPFQGRQFQPTPNILDSYSASSDSVQQALAREVDRGATGPELLKWIEEAIREAPNMAQQDFLTALKSDVPNLIKARTDRSVEEHQFVQDEQARSLAHDAEEQNRYQASLKDIRDWEASTPWGAAGLPNPLDEYTSQYLNPMIPQLVEAANEARQVHDDAVKTYDSRSALDGRVSDLMDIVYGRTQQPGKAVASNFNNPSRPENAPAAPPTAQQVVPPPAPAPVPAPAPTVDPEALRQGGLRPAPLDPEALRLERLRPAPVDAEARRQGGMRPEEQHVEPIAYVQQVLQELFESRQPPVDPEARRQEGMRPPLPVFGPELPPTDPEARRQGGLRPTQKPVYGSDSEARRQRALQPEETRPSRPSRRGSKAEERRMSNMRPRSTFKGNNAQRTVSANDARRPRPAKRTPSQVSQERRARSGRGVRSQRWEDLAPTRKASEQAGRQAAKAVGEAIADSHFLQQQGRNPHQDALLARLLMGY